MGHACIGARTGIGSPDDTSMFGTGAGCWSDTGSTSPSRPPSHHIGSSASPYDSAEDGAAVGESARAPAWLNAGEALDMSLHAHWASSEPALRVDACELEQFGRSKSF